MSSLPLQCIAIPLAKLLCKDRAAASQGELLVLLLHAILGIGSAASPIKFALEAVKDIKGVSPHRLPGLLS
jgi:hypothetical protein